jgi:hypothetical protein
VASLSNIRTALKKTIASYTDSTLFVYDTVADLVNLPAVIVEPMAADYTGAFARGMDVWDFNLYVLCSRADTSLGQKQLDAFVTGAGADSIPRALNDHADLGLRETDATVQRMVGYGGRFENSKVHLVGAVLQVRVITDGRA